MPYNDDFSSFQAVLMDFFLRNSADVVGKVGTGHHR